jgi:3-dehydroquinate synthase
MRATIRVDLGDRGYDVRIEPGALDAVGAAAALPGASAAVVISDSNVAPLYAGRVRESLESAGLAAAVLDFPAGEAHKTLATYASLMDGLLAVEPALDRDAVVVALGGGVVGDVAGFVAATALRGLRLVQCPTTLLADVDSSVGGKTALDHPAGKNLIGAFHQPAAVLIDVEALKTLADEELANGLAECVKHGVIRSAPLLDFIEEAAEQILAREPEVMAELVARNVAIKAAVVAADEHEAGERAHLNFGHTIGHAIETLVGYDRIRHGEAVSLGIVAANHVAVRRGLIEDETAQRVTELLRRLRLPVSRAGLDPDATWRIMQHDKKARGGQVRMVLPTVLGQVAVFGDITPDAVTDAVEALA